MHVLNQYEELCCISNMFLVLVIVRLVVTLV